MEIFAYVGGCCGGWPLGRADKGGLRRPQETDPLLTLSMRGHPAISSVDTNRLISQLISDSKQQRRLTGALTVQ